MEGIGRLSVEQALHFSVRKGKERLARQPHFRRIGVGEVADVRKEVANVEILELHLFGSEAFVAGKGLFEDVVVDIGGVLRGRVGRRVEIVAQGQAGGVVHRHALDVGQEALEGHVAAPGSLASRAALPSEENSRA